MSAGVIKCRKGDPCRFSVRVRGGIGTQYTRARFQARDAWDESLPALLHVDQDTGVQIDHGEGVVTVAIGATLTDALPMLRQPREVAAQLRLYNPLDADDRVSFPIPFRLLPDAIADG